MPPQRTMFLLLFCLLSLSVSAQERILSYNLLNYPGSDTTRNAAFRTVLAAVRPDVLVVQEVTSQTGVDLFLSSVLNAVAPGEFTAGSFINGPDTDNAIFVRNSRFTVLGHRAIATALRNISEFTIRHAVSFDTLRIYSVHLKASTGSSNEALRAAEVDSLRKVTDALPAGSSFLVVGDFNIYGSTEAAYQRLLEQRPGTDGAFYDVLNLTGTWNALQYAPYHTQSPRVRSFGGGATGGLDDRFDMILMSRSVRDSGRVRYVPGSLTPFGNDGDHYNDSINRPPNAAVSQTIANALHEASDHLPLFASFLFAESPLPVQLASFTAEAASGDVVLRWSTLTETNCAGFEIERRVVSGQWPVPSSGEASVVSGQWVKIGFVAGAGNSAAPREYSYVDKSVTAGRFVYRLKQLDNDGKFEYFGNAEVEIGTAPKETTLGENFPNPFNPSTTIRFSVREDAQTTLRIYDAIGREVDTLFSGHAEARRYYDVRFDASGMTSGVYFYELRSGIDRMVRKMTLVR